MTVRQSVICAAAVALLASPRADAAQQTPAMLAEITAALSGNDSHKAEQLATAALADGGLTGAQRSRLLLDRGLAREQLGDHNDALLDLTQAIEIHALPQPDQGLALFARGMALDALGRLPEALGDYTSSIQLSPGSAPALNNRANAYRRLGRLDEARRDYLASLTAGNSQPEYPYFGLGQIAEAQQDADGARGFYAKAVAANPDYRLAADRLNALGGPRAGALADKDVVLLHSPQDVARQDTPSTKPLPAVPPLPPGGEQTHLRLHPQVATVNSGHDTLSLRPAIVGSKSTVAGRDQQAQLGAWRQETEASQAWQRAVKLAGNDLAGLSPHIVPVDLPGRGRYYRLRVSADAGAAALCSSLTAKGLDCLPVRD